jgi:hypothetical protein
MHQSPVEGIKASMKHPPAIVERLLAHARICRDIANATFNEETARKLDRMAEECLKAANETDPETWNQMFPTGRRRTA